MGKAYVALRLVESGDFMVSKDLNHLGKWGAKINQNPHLVSNAPTPASDFSSLASRIESTEICSFNLKNGSADAWFGLGYAMALEKPFVAVVDENDLPLLLSLHGNGRMAFPAPRNRSDTPQEDRVCLALTDETDLDLKADILTCLAHQDRYQGYGSLKYQLDNAMTIGRKGLATILASLLEEGLVSEQYNVLGGDEVTETFVITTEGLAWLQGLEEACDPANDNPEIGRSNLLFFAD